MQVVQKWILLVFSLISFCGCAGPLFPKSELISTIPNQEQPPAMTAGPVNGETVLNASEGSLWKEGGGLSEMFINAKARRVGDILTIAIVESSSASNKASTNTGRASELNVGLTSFFGLEQEFPSTKRFFNPFSPATGSFENSFDGTGSTIRSGALSASITARIIQVLPNGNFIIEGNREVRVNNENQIITLTGVVRPRDISAENVIQSTYIADARINYSGTGVINDEQRPGWLMRIIDNIWPF